MTFTNLTPGVWNVDPTHTELGFSVRHMMVSKVRGRFTDFEAEVVAGDTPETSSVRVTVPMDSIDTKNADRDGHLRSNDFFDIENHPTMTFVSTRITESTLEGDLTIKGTTKPVVFDLDFNGVSADPWGNTVAGFEAETEVNRKDFGLNWNVTVEGGGVLVGEKVKLNLEVELQKAPQPAETAGATA